MELHIRNVSKTYANGVHALKKVSLTIPAGMYGLLENRRNRRGDGIGDGRLGGGGVFAGNEPIYLQKHHIRSGKQTITVTVPSIPTRAGIDPRSLLVDWVTGDNVEKVTAKR